MAWKIDKINEFKKTTKYVTCHVIDSRHSNIIDNSHENYKSDWEHKSKKNL